MDLIIKKTILTVKFAKDLWYVDDGEFRHTYLFHIGLVKSDGHKFGLDIAILNLMIHFAVGK